MEYWELQEEAPTQLQPKQVQFWKRLLTMVMCMVSYSILHYVNYAWREGELSTQISTCDIVGLGPMYLFTSASAPDTRVSVSRRKETAPLPNPNGIYGWMLTLDYRLLISMTLRLSGRFRRQNKLGTISMPWHRWQWTSFHNATHLRLLSLMT